MPEENQRHDNSEGGSPLSITRKGIIKMIEREALLLISDSSVSSTLNWVDLPIVSSNNCANVYGSFSASQICASGANRRSTCNVSKWEQETNRSIPGSNHWNPFYDAPGGLRWSFGDRGKWRPLDRSGSRLFRLLGWMYSGISRGIYKS